MFKLISITAISVGALLTALSGTGTTMPARSDEPAITVRVSQRKILAMAGEFHARLLVNISRRLDAAARPDYCDAEGEGCIALAGKPTRDKGASTR